MKYNIGFTDRKPSSSRRPTSGSVSRNLNLSSSSLYKGNDYRSIKKFSPTSKNNFGSKTRKPVSNGKPGVGQKKKTSAKKIILKVFTILLGIFFFTFVTGAIVLGVWLKQLEASLPEPGKLIDRSSDQTTIIYDRNGTELYKVIGDVNRTYIKLADLTPENQRNVIVSILAAEDAEFFQHKGIDLPGIVYCGIVSAKDYVSGSSSGGCGASTITQQLVRNTLLKDVIGDAAYQKTVERKLKEILLTMQVEQTMKKEEILEMYINEIYMGGVNYGFETAAKSIYSKSIKDLTLAELAVLGGIVQSPSIYSPALSTNPEKAKERQLYVFEQMKKHKDTLNNTLDQLGLPNLTDEDITLAQAYEIKYEIGKFEIKAPHFVTYVRKLLEDQYGVDRVTKGGLKVITSIDYSVQQIAEDELKKGVKNFGVPYRSYNGALVALDPNTGQVLAMVGSVDFWNTTNKKIDGNVNVATSARQMGSAVKPITYLAAYSKGYSTGMAAPDGKDFNFGYNAKNWDGKYYGDMVAREALVQSRNIPALYVMELVGVEGFIEAAQKLGITTLKDPSKYGLSLTLGAGDMKLLELTHAFSVFANEGVKQPITPILKVTDNKGEVLYEWKKTNGERVYDEKDVYMLNWSLCDLGGFGDRLRNSLYLKNGQPWACAKGGTTNGPTDLTGFFYHQNIAVGVWTGNNDNSVVRAGLYSTTISLPIARNFMLRVDSKYPSKLYSRPAGVASTVVCEDTGHVPSGETQCTKKVPALYITGKAPAQDKRETVKVCKASGKVPTNLVAAEKYGLVETRYLFKDFTIENTKQKENFKKYLTSTHKYLFEMPESAECKLPLGPDNAPIVDIELPSADASVEAGKTIVIKASAQALGTVASVQFKFDGVNISGGLLTVAPYEITYAVPLSTTAGVHTVSAVVTDDLGKIGTTAVSINVTTPAPIYTLSLTLPSSGSEFGTDVNTALAASVSGGSVSRVDFVITQTSGGTYSNTIIGAASGGNWTATWSASGLSLGSYSIKAIAYVSGNKVAESGSASVIVK